ncbi:hypothetical protein D9758_004730 [Tetrapyrgos nigripes]|uniref:Uncharacterized protein n=1 Tax=Tetrapyrgos nigripes TaxID=182062 RepID=A0A8H5H0D8_9AGAR|nr:hypothetical protein D9758_004730 [Tetrapyrgos nigripes]
MYPHPHPQLQARCILNDSIPSRAIHQKVTGMSEPTIASICSRTSLHPLLRHRHRHRPRSPYPSVVRLGLVLDIPVALGLDSRSWYTSRQRGKGIGLGLESQKVEVDTGECL